MISPSGRAIYPLSFAEFQNQARLDVIGALSPQELVEFNKGLAAFGPRAQRFLSDCCALRDAFALSLRPPRAAKPLRDRLTSLAARSKPMDCAKQPT